MQKVLHTGATIYVASIAAFELWYGVSKSSRREANTKRLETFFAGPMNVLAFEGEDAAIAGAVRADLEAAGKPIGAYDLLIAGQALRHEMTLVTANVSEFARVKGLVVQDWARS